MTRGSALGHQRRLAPSLLVLVFAWLLALSSSSGCMEVQNPLYSEPDTGTDQDDNSDADDEALPLELELRVTLIKRFFFSWKPAEGAHFYQLLRSASGDGEYEQVGGNILATSTSIAVTIPMHVELDASYIVRACSEGCRDSEPVHVIDSLIDGIAYLKASDNLAGSSDSIDWFGYSVALSADGDTLAVGAYKEDSAATGIDGDQVDDSAVGSGAVYLFVRSNGSWSQRAYVKASNTSDYDRFGSSVALSADGDTLAVGAHYEQSEATGVDGVQQDNSIARSGAVYLFARAGDAWSQQAYIKASNTDAYDEFGLSVALSADGNTLAVGAHNEQSEATDVDGDDDDDSADQAGAVYLFARTGESWAQRAYLKASNTDAGDGFGRSVALSASGELLCIGAPHEQSAATGIDGEQQDNSADDAGAVYLFARDGQSWTQQAYLKASNTDAGDEFGHSVALSTSGDALAVGARLEASDGINDDPLDNNAAGAGAVYLFTQSNGAWSQQAYLKASNAGASDEFGTGVALSADGDTLAVGAPLESSIATGIDGNQANDSALESGATYLFTRTGGVWSQHTYIKADHTGAGDSFGHGVALSADGGALAIGAHLESSDAVGIDGDGDNDDAGASGAVYTFLSANGSWSQQSYIKASKIGGYGFGASVALSRDERTLAVGAPKESGGTTGIDGGQDDDADPATRSGAVFVFAWADGGWSQQAHIKASNTDANDEFGHSVTLSADGHTLAVGAHKEDSAATGVDGNQQDNDAANAGAVYLFVRDELSQSWSQQAYLKADHTDSDDRFGRRVALSADGGTLAVGADQDDSDAAPDAGAVVLFARDQLSQSWSQQAYLEAEHGDTGDRFGSSVALSAGGETLAVGAEGEASAATGVDGDQQDNAAPGAGAVYLFGRDPMGSAWSQQAYLKASNAEPGDGFGASVALTEDGHTLAVGGPHEQSAATGSDGDQQDNSSPDAGAVYLFTRDLINQAWSQRAYLKASHSDSGDGFGHSVALTGDGITLAVGAYLESSAATSVDGDALDNGAPDAGAVYVFARKGDAWPQQAYVKAEHSGAGDWFGYSIALSGDGDTLAVGAYKEDSAATGIGGDQQDNSAYAAGAVYLY